MDGKQFFDDLQSKINQILEESPAKDIEKNVKALLMQGFARLDLVTREEFDAQSVLLQKLLTRLDELEARVLALEAQITESQTTPAS